MKLVTPDISWHLLGIYQVYLMFHGELGLVATVPNDINSENWWIWVVKIIVQTV